MQGRTCRRISAADFLNITDVHVVCVEHEFGIFGEPAGGHVLVLLCGRTKSNCAWYVSCLVSTRLVVIYRIN